MPKLKLRYLTMISSLIFVIFILYLIITKGEIKLIDYPISTLGNTQENFLLFILFSIFIILLFMYIVFRLYKERKIKMKWWIYFIPMFVIITVLIPYKDDNITYKRLHTLFAIIAASLILFAMHIYNKNNNEKNRIIKKINNIIPFVSLIGTITLYLFTGINTIMQIFYLTFLIYWINQVSYKY